MKEKHNIWFERKAWERLILLSKKSDKSLSFIVNKAVLAYKRTEVEDYKEIKKELARKLAFIQRQMKAAEEAEKASIKSKE